MNVSKMHRNMNELKIKWLCTWFSDFTLGHLSEYRWKFNLKNLVPIGGMI